MVVVTCFVMCGCFDNCVGVLVIGVLVFTVFCIDLTRSKHAATLKNTVALVVSMVLFHFICLKNGLTMLGMRSNGGSY